MDDPIKKDLFESIDYDELLTGEESESVILESLRDSASAGVATKAGLQMDALQTAMDNFSKYLNESAIAKSTGLPVRTAAAQYKGFAAEEYFKHTLKINALAEGVPDYRLGSYTNGILPDGSDLSRIDMKVDISNWTRKHFWNKPMRASEYQSKIHNNAADYAKDINNPQYKDVEFVGGSGQGVNDTIKVTIDGKTIASDSITPEEAEKLAEQMKDQSTPEYAKRQEKIDKLNAKSFGDAVKAGALVGFTISTIREIVNVIKNRHNLSEDQFVESIKNIMCGTAEGAIRGGAINISVQLMGKMLGQEITASSLKAVPAMAIANFSVDLAKDIYKCFVEESIDTDDLLCNSVDNMFASFAGFGGAWVGGQMATSLLVSIKASAATGAAIGSSVGPIGTIIGSVVGGVVFGIGARLISNTANKDAYAAFEECISEINSHVEMSGVERIYYFADQMGSLSEHKLSFKDLLPCYNLISDLREYNYHKKAMKNIAEQLKASLDELDVKKKEALIKLEAAHKSQLNRLVAAFKDQRDMMRDDLKDSLNTYVATSYMQFVGVYAIHAESISELIQEYDEEKEIHSSIITYMRNRNRANEEINSMLSELLADEDANTLLEPFIEKITWFMKQDEMLVGRQFITFDETISLVNGGVLS